MWLPTPIYDRLPHAFAGAGTLALIYLPTIGQLSGALMLMSAYVIFRMRREAAAARLAGRRRPSARPLRL